MITLDIPGRGEIHLKHLVLDYNGTLAVDSKLIGAVHEKLSTLQDVLTIHVITADTFGNVRENLRGIECELAILEKENQQPQKAHYIRNLGVDNVVAIGNGLNDAMMLEEAALGIAVIQDEGASSYSVSRADIICRSIHHAMDLLIKPLRSVASLRK